MNQLSVQSIYTIRDDRILFDDFSFDATDGEIIQIKGANGCGKTSLLKILSGLLLPQQGNVLWNGEAIAQQKIRYYQSLLYIGHENGIKSELTVVENLEIFAALNPVSAAITIEAAVDQVGLSGFEEVYVSRLSAGQKRRVAMAKLYLSQTSLWLLDEPFAAIDYQGVEMIEQFFLKQVAQSGMVIFTSHQALAIPDLPVRVISLS